jgi:type I restriction-modification system, M subunit, putative
MLEVKFDNKGNIYSHIREKWLVAKPEEIVRQNFVCHLINEYDYKLNQMAEELDFATGQRGGAQARADIAIYKSAKDKAEKNNPFIIVECKADNIRIGANDYLQGELYARLSNAPFFVTHNNSETRFWEVIKDKAPGYRQEISNIPKNGDSDKQVENLLKSLVAFKEDEFAKLLDNCHNIIRNAEKYDPSKAFDEISKILFMKVFVERNAQKSGKTNIFSLDYITQRENDPGKDPNNSVLQTLFNNTKKQFAKDQIFKENEKIELKETTIKQIIKELEIYNLSLTSADIKGIAFEKFLGTTFRGELGQFFTPRSVVNFMVDVVNPCENEVCCDPSSGSGGFLINIFNKVKHDIQKDIIKQYEKFKSDLLKGKDDDSITNEQAKLLKDEFDRLQKELDNDERSVNTRLYKLSNFFIYGTDANDRMARTSKMNMIMHGDGHGGIHHHDGLLNVNGIFENRFDVILTNPPFGQQVTKENVVLETDSVMRFATDAELRYEPDEKIKPRDNYSEYVEEYYKRYGKEAYQKAQLKILENIGKPIASLFDLKPNLMADKTQHLFINRCLDLLKPSGRLGIVLDETVLNGSDTEYVRKFVEGRAFLRGIVSLSENTFKSSRTNTKTSILFIQKFSDDNKIKWDNLIAKHTDDLCNENTNEILNLKTIINYKTKKGEAKIFDKGDKVKAKKDLLNLEKQIATDAWQRAKNDFDYPIFFAHAEHTGITSTGETGENVLNDLIDIKEDIYNSVENKYDEIVKKKGIATLFKEFIKEYKISWGKDNE